MSRNALARGFRQLAGWIAPACGWRTYLITLSACRSSEGGIPIPNALAVSRLTVNSYFLASENGILVPPHSGFDRLVRGSK